MNQLLYITSSVSACQELFEFIFASSQDVWDSVVSGFCARGCLPPTCNILHGSMLSVKEFFASFHFFIFTPIICARADLSRADWRSFPGNRRSPARSAALYFSVSAARIASRRPRRPCRFAGREVNTFAEWPPHMAVPMERKEFRSMSCQRRIFSPLS